MGIRETYDHVMMMMMIKSWTISRSITHASHNNKWQCKIEPRNHGSCAMETVKAERDIFRRLLMMMTMSSFFLPFAVLVLMEYGMADGNFWFFSSESELQTLFGWCWFSPYLCGSRRGNILMLQPSPHYFYYLPLRTTLCMHTHTLTQSKTRKKKEGYYGEEASGN